MELNFTKLEGAGNDFVFLDEKAPSLTAEQIQTICDRRKGVGADGIVRISRRDQWTMEIWNADGRSAGMCGNALRCTAYYLDEKRLLEGSSFVLDTADGIKTVIIRERGEEYQVQANLGKIRWSPDQVPFEAPDGHEASFLDGEICIDGKPYRISVLSMGNPHCVLFSDDLSDERIFSLGPALENHPLFPDRCNVEFVRVLNREEVKVRVWERGCGETMACGTGAAAVCATASELDLTERALLCHMPGGTLRMERTEEDRILKTGPARLVYRGKMTLP